MSKNKSTTKQKQSKSELEDIHVVAYGLLHYIQEALERLRAIKAFEEIIENNEKAVGNNELLSLSYQTMRDYLIIQTAVLYDNSETCGMINCSMNELKALLVQYEGNHTEIDKNGIIATIDALDSECKQNVKKARNKKKAHHDLLVTFSGTSLDISTAEMEHILTESYKVVSDVFEYRFGIKLMPLNLDKRKDLYKECISLYT